MKKPSPGTVLAAFALLNSCNLAYSRSTQTSKRDHASPTKIEPKCKKTPGPTKPETAVEKLRARNINLRPFDLDAYLRRKNPDVRTGAGVPNVDWKAVKDLAIIEGEPQNLSLTVKNSFLDTFYVTGKGTTDRDKVDGVLKAARVCGGLRLIDAPDLLRLLFLKPCPQLDARSESQGKLRALSLDYERPFHEVKLSYVASEAFAKARIVTNEAWLKDAADLMEKIAEEQDIKFKKPLDLYIDFTIFSNGDMDLQGADGRLARALFLNPESYSGLDRSSAAVQNNIGLWLKALSQDSAPKI
jgi:hypothetical protein